MVHQVSACAHLIFFLIMYNKISQLINLLEIWVVTQNHVGILGVQTLVKVFDSYIIAIMVVGKQPPPIWKCGSYTRVKTHQQIMCF
jgi:hypothetical protein